MDDIPIEQRYYPAAVSYRADNTPDRVFAVLPKGDALEDGFYDFTYSALDKAVDKAAYWLDEQLKNVDQSNGHTNGDSDHGATTITYFGVNDFRYIFLLIASLKTGRKLMLPMPANTTEGRVKLLKAQGCRHVLASKTCTAEWGEVASQLPGGQLIDVPEISYFLEPSKLPRYPNTREYSKARYQTMFLIQSSGTTGDPKPIAIPYSFLESFLVYSEENKKSPPDQQLAYAALLGGSYMPVLMPMSWGYTMIAAGCWPLTSETVPIMPPSTMPHPMTADYVDKLMKALPKGNKTAIVFVPSVLQDLAKDPERLKFLQNCDWVGYVGAPLDETTGDLVSQYTRVQSIIGQTESGGYPLMLNAPEDWKFHRFHPTLNSFFLGQYDGDLYEICVQREPDDARHCFADPNLQVFHTKDLVQMVPGREKERLWKSAGRVDDFVKLSSMTKFNGVQIEGIIARSPHVRICQVAGDARPKSFAIVEPVEEMPREEAIEKIWPAVEEANKTILEEARLSKNMIIITHPGKPMKRLAKGTVDRRDTLKVYADDIEALYEE